VNQPLALVRLAGLPLSLTLLSKLPHSPVKPVRRRASASLTMKRVSASGSTSVALSLIQACGWK
jgi:hypothetical protein